MKDVSVTGVPLDPEMQMVAAFFGDSKGYFVEVGANEPRIRSQTWHLEQAGWSGAVAVIAASRNLMDIRVSWGEDGWRIARPSSTPDQCWALRRGAAYTLDSPLSMPCLQKIL